AQEADAAAEHELRAGHARHQRDLGVPPLDGERGAEAEPVLAVLLGDHLLGKQEAHPAATLLALESEDPDLAEEAQLLLGRAAVERLLGAHVVELRATADERALDVHGAALPGRVDVQPP